MPKSRRPHDEEDDVQPAPPKRQKTVQQQPPPQPPPEAAGAAGGAGGAEPAEVSLLSFSDDVLFLIFNYLTCSGDLLRLTETCKRLARVAGDKALWTNVDTRGAAPLNLRELRKLLPFLHDRTRSLTVQGFLKSASSSSRTLRDSVSPSILRSISERCPNLEEFSLVDCYVDASKITISMFPSSIQVLRIKDSEVVNIPDKASYFSNVHTAIPALRVMDLTGAGWFSNHSLMAICKCEELQELDLRGCFRIGECFAYTALAARFGFQKLRKADLRDTRAGNSEVPCFGRLKDITHLYLGYTSRENRQRDDLSEDSGDRKINDRGLLSLVAFSDDDPVSKLSFLSLGHTDATDAIVQKLAASLPLTHMDVTGTKVTQAGVVAVKRVNPRCEVIWSEPSAASQAQS